MRLVHSLEPSGGPAMAQQPLPWVGNPGTQASLPAGPERRCCLSLYVVPGQKGLTLLSLSLSICNLGQTPPSLPSSHGRQDKGKRRVWKERAKEASSKGLILSVEAQAKRTLGEMNQLPLFHSASPSAEELPPVSSHREQDGPSPSPVKVREQQTAAGKCPSGKHRGDWRPVKNRRPP